MLGKSLQTRDCPETLFRVYRCARTCRPGHSGFLRLEDVASVAPSIKVKILHLSTPPVHAGVAASCPCGRTRTGTQSALKTTSYVYYTPDNCTSTLTHLLSIFEFVLVLPLSPPYGLVCDDRLSFDPLDRSIWL